MSESSEIVRREGTELTPASVKDLSAKVETYGLDHRFGYRVTFHESELKNELTVALELKTAMGPPLVFPVWGPHKDSLSVRGIFEREIAFWEGVARYLNSGGELSDVLDRLEQAHNNLPKFGPPPGFKLVRTLQDVPETQHIFVSRSENRAIIWSEDQFVEVTTLEDLADRLAEDFDVEDQDVFSQGSSSPEATA